MASPAVDIGTGTTIAFATSSFSAQIVDVNHTGVSRPALPTSHMGTSAPTSSQMNNATYILGKIIDGGQVELTLHYNPDTIPPLDEDPEQITITTKSGATLVFSGGIIEHGARIPLEDVMEQNVVVKVCGPIAVTAAS